MLGGGRVGVYSRQMVLKHTILYSHTETVLERRRTNQLLSKQGARYRDHGSVQMAYLCMCVYIHTHTLKAGFQGDDTFVGLVSISIHGKESRAISVKRC